MSSIGSPVQLSLIQTAQAQQVASKARDKERATTDRARRFEDQADLRVSGTEADEALRRLPQNDSEQAESEHQARPQPMPLHADEDDADGDRPRIDIQA